MSRNVLINLIVAALMFLAPLAGAPERILHPAPWIGCIAAAVILISQPPLGPKKMIADRGDRLSGLVIFIGVIGSQVAAVLEFGYREALVPAPWSIPVAAGAAVVAGGLTLRLCAIRTLGRFFTSTVEVQESQRVVQNGPYRLLRHPSYTGTLVAQMGVVAALASPIGALLVAALSVPAYLFRIRVEEQVLMRGLGDAYRDYRTRTWRLVPFVF